MTVTEQTQAPGSVTEHGYRAEGNRLAAEALLRCWIRERGVRWPTAAGGAGSAGVGAGEGLGGGSGERAAEVAAGATREGGESLTLQLDFGDSVLRVPVEYWSRTGIHRLGVPSSALGPLRPGAVARLIGSAAGASGDGLEQLVQRVVESAERIGDHLADRARRPGASSAATPFLAAEQGLLAGHPLHPTPKSRDALSAEEAARYSPELRGSVPLHWFAVAPDLAAHDSELGPTAPDLAAFLSGLTPDGRVLVPAHPWQAAELLCRAEVRELMDAGTLGYLGEAGPEWYPTSSLRTVYRRDSPVMLKLSLGLRITNSRRQNLRKELLRGVEAHRLLAGELGRRLLTAHPGFRVLTDAGYLAVDGVPGLDVSFRHSPFQQSDHVFCVAALTDLGRGAVFADGAAHELAAHLHGLAANEGRPLRAVGLDWFARYVNALIVPLFWLDAEHGVTLEAHQQNTLIQLGGSGYPAVGWYRDNQGFYYRASAIERLEALSGLPRLGLASETVVPDDVVTERLLYYVGINNLMGMVGALGCAGIADERDLLGLAADLLAPLRGHRPVDLLLGAQSLRGKANLLTRAADLDELVGDLATQSVYVEIANPFAALDDRGTAATEADAEAEAGYAMKSATGEARGGAS